LTNRKLQRSIIGRRERALVQRLVVQRVFQCVGSRGAAWHYAFSSARHHHPSAGRIAISRRI